MVRDEQPFVKLDSLGVSFDEERLVSDAGLLLPASLANRLELERLVSDTVRLGDGVPGAALSGRKVMSLVHGMLAAPTAAMSWGLCSDTRCWRPRRSAPSCAFSFGRVRQLDRVLDQSLQRAWTAGAGPGRECLVIDIDSFVGEVHGYQKQGAGYGYTSKLGYPLLATRAGSTEVLHIRNRKGQANSQRGNPRFVAELLARVRRAGATGTILVRADSGFENKKVFRRRDSEGIAFSIGVKLQKQVREAIEQIPRSSGSGSRTTPRAVAQRSPSRRSGPGAWSCAASTPSAPRSSCLRPGDTSPLLATAASRCNWWRQSIAQHDFDRALARIRALPALC